MVNPFSTGATSISILVTNEKCQMSFLKNVCFLASPRAEKEEKHALPC